MSHTCTSLSFPPVASNVLLLTDVRDDGRLLPTPKPSRIPPACVQQSSPDECLPSVMYDDPYILGRSRNDAWTMPRRDPDPPLMHSPQGRQGLRSVQVIDAKHAILAPHSQSIATLGNGTALCSETHSTVFLVILDHIVHVNQYLPRQGAVCHRCTKSTGSDKSHPPVHVHSIP